MSRGYFAVALINPKTPANVGGVLRACGAFGATMVYLVGARGKRTGDLVCAPANTQQYQKHAPVVDCADLLLCRPHDCPLIAVECCGKRDLPNFVHPEQALYVFGPEDGNVPAAILAAATHTIRIPTRYCLNLAQSVNVVLYDRAAKRGDWGVTEVPDETD